MVKSEKKIKRGEKAMQKMPKIEKKNLFNSFWGPIISPLSFSKGTFKRQTFRVKPSSVSPLWSRFPNFGLDLDFFG